MASRRELHKALGIPNVRHLSDRKSSGSIAVTHFLKLLKNEQSQSNCAKESVERPSTTNYYEIIMKNHTCPKV